MKRILIFLLAIISFIPSIQAQTDSTIIDPNKSSYDSKDSKIILVNQIDIITKQIISGFATIDLQEDSIYAHKKKSLKIDNDIELIKNQFDQISKNIDKLEIFLAITNEHPDYTAKEVDELKENLLFFKNIFEKRFKKFLKKTNQQNPKLN